MRMPLRPTALALFATVAVAITLAAPTYADAALHASQVGSFSQPVYLTAPPGDPHRLFVVEQAGRIMEVRDGQKLDTPFLDIRSDVKFGGEQGLLSMAFAPDYATSGRYYVFYTAPRSGDSGGNVIIVEEFGPAGRRIVFRVDHPTNGNHNGGQLQFGPDGLLYAGTGDGGSGNDPPGNAQNVNSRLGKLLRTDPLSTSGQPEIYAYGLRNPFRFSFDRATGDLTIGDVGQNAYEEVDFAAAGTAAGRNYGWNCREGAHDTPGVSCVAPGAVDPVLEKAHSSTDFCAIIGGYVVRDSSLPELLGRYVYGDNCADGIRSVTLPTARDDAATGLSIAGLTSFGEDSCGHLYATSGQGPVYRIDGDAFTPCPEGGGGTPPPGGGGGGGNPPPGGGGNPPPGGGNPPPGGGDPGTTPPDTRAPVVRVGSARKQHVLDLRGVRVSVKCDELCGATVTGRVHVRGLKRAPSLRRVTRQVAAGRRVKVTLRASRTTLRLVRRALHRGRHVSVSVQVVARDAAGNAGRASRTVRAVG
jgi:glucose/arabinose dehydrogenase